MEIILMDIPIIHLLMNINMEALVQIPTRRSVYASWYETWLGYWPLNIARLISPSCLVNSKSARDKSPELCEKSERQHQDIYPNDSYILKDSFIFILHMSILHVCAPHEYSCSLRATDHLELELPMVVSHHMAVERQIWVFCKSSKPLNTASSPGPTLEILACFYFCDFNGLFPSDSFWHQPDLPRSFGLKEWDDDRHLGDIFE